MGVYSRKKATRRPEKAATPHRAPRTAQATQFTGDVALSMKMRGMYWGLWKTTRRAVVKSGNTSSSHAHLAKRGPQFAGAFAGSVTLHCPVRFAMSRLSASLVSH